MPSNPTPSALTGLDRIQTAIAELRGVDPTGVTEAISRTWTRRERYCVESDRPTRLIPGDRCRDHGGAPEMCTTVLRPARCRHPHRSPNHPHPHCSECGLDLDQLEAIRD